MRAWEEPTATQPSTRNQAELKEGLSELFYRVGRVRVARRCGVRPNTVSVWLTRLPGLKPAVSLRYFAEHEGFDTLVSLLDAHIAGKARLHAEQNYLNSARLFALCGRWPMPRGRRNWSARGWDWSTLKQPPSPPDRMPADKITVAKQLLECAGWTLVAACDGSWKPVRTI